MAGSAGGKMSFPEFLKVMHKQSQVEEVPREVVEAFKAGDPHRRGVVSATHLRHLLVHWGEQLSPREGKSSLTHRFSSSGFLLKLVLKGSLSVRIL